MVIFTDRAHEEDDCLPMVIFTDRAHEEDDCLPTRGAVLIDPSSDLHFCFGGEIPWSFVNKRRASGIHGWWTELRCYRCWSPKWLVPSVRSSTKCYGSWTRTLPSAVLGSDSLTARDTSAILGVNAHRHVALEATHCFTRVPSKMNFEDDASRLSFGAYQGLYERTRVDWTSSCMQTIVATCAGEKIPSLARDTSTPEFSGEESC